MQSIKVIIAGGGTGGHIFPAVAIGHALQKLHSPMTLLYVGAKGKMEMEKIPQEGFEIIGLDIAGFNRSNWLKNILLPIKLIKSWYQAGKAIKQFKPDVVIGVGGYASFPVLNRAQGLNIPTLIQEQNSYAGKSNQYLAKKANWVCVAYDEMEQFFPKEKIINTGNPVRALISQSHCSTAEGLSFFNLDPNKKTILIVGGSLGAKSINEACALYFEEWCQQDIQIIWQTGKPFYETAKNLAAPYAQQVKVFDFIREMDKAYAAATIIISRAGALAIAELCIVAKPVIFVPYPYAAEDHQSSNALALVRKNAAFMIQDQNVKAELKNKADQIFNDHQLQASMSANLKALACTNADERIAQHIIQLAQKSKGGKVK